MTPELPLAVLLALGTGTLALYSPLAPQLWCLWLTRVGQPCLFPLPQCHRLPVPVVPVPGAASALPVGWGCPHPPVRLSHLPRLLSQPSVGRKGGRGGWHVGVDLLGWQSILSEEQTPWEEMRLPGPSVWCPCQIIQPYKYKSSQAQREEDSCWASYTFLERIKAIQSSSLLH